MSQTPSDVPEPLPPLPKAERKGLTLAIGILAGAVLSALVWIPFWKSQNPSPVPLVIVPLFKIAIGITLIVATRRFRFAGLGLMLSMLVGAMIFFGACMGNLNIK